MERCFYRCDASLFDLSEFVLTFLHGAKLYAQYAVASCVIQQHACKAAFVLYTQFSVHSHRQYSLFCEQQGLQKVQTPPVLLNKA